VTKCGRHFVKDEIDETKAVSSCRGRPDSDHGRVVADFDFAKKKRFFAMNVYWDRMNLLSESY